MRRVSMGTRDELTGAAAGRYSEAGRIERGRIVGRRRIYGEAIREALILLGKRPTGYGSSD